MASVSSTLAGVHLTASPLVLLVALAFLVPWASLTLKARKRWNLAVGRYLRRRLERAYGVRVLVYTGRLERARTFKLCRRISEVQSGQALVLVLDTRGGDIDAGAQVARALAAHRGRVTVRVPDECWSAGTIVACAADDVLLGPHANLGPTDAWATFEPGMLYAAQHLLAEEAGISLDTLRARALLRPTMQTITAVRVARGQDPTEAWALAERLTMQSDDHQRPIYALEARELGLPVSVSRDPVWAEMMIRYGWSR